VERLLISLIFHCSKNEKHDRAIEDLHASFKGMFRFHFCHRRSCECLTVSVELSDVEFELLKAPATACITVSIYSVHLM